MDHPTAANVLTPERLKIDFHNFSNISNHLKAPPDCGQNSRTFSQTLRREQMMFGYERVSKASALVEAVYCNFVFPDTAERKTKIDEMDSNKTEGAGCVAKDGKLEFLHLQALKKRSEESQRAKCG